MVDRATVVAAIVLGPKYRSRPVHFPVTVIIKSLSASAPQGTLDTLTNTRPNTSRVLSHQATSMASQRQWPIDIDPACAA